MLNFAIIGCGKISNKHSDILGNKKIKNTNLVAICDKDKKKSKILSKKFKIPDFSDFSKMFKSVKIDVAVVLTESGYHAKHVIEISKYVKNIIVEKPLALNMKEANMMINICKKNKVKLFLVKQNRFNLPITKLKEAIDEKRFGKMIIGTVRVRWCRDQKYYNQAKWRGTKKLDGGVIFNQASHHIDLLIWMMGDVKSVYGKSSKALAKIESEDTAAVLLKFKSGALGIIEATTATRPKDLEGSISILGEKGSVEISGYACDQIRYWNFKKKLKKDSITLKKFSRNPTGIRGFSHLQYYKYVVDSIINNKKNLIDGNEGKKSLKLILDIYKSFKINKEIRT